MYIIYSYILCINNFESPCVVLISCAILSALGDEGWERIKVTHGIDLIIPYRFRPKGN